MDTSTDVRPHGFQIGDTIATTVYSIGGREERVTGTVTGYQGRRESLLVVQTDTHGALSVEWRKAARS